MTASDSRSDVRRWSWLAVLTSALVLAACVPITPEPAHSPAVPTPHASDAPVMPISIDNFSSWFVRVDEDQFSEQVYTDLMIELAYCILSKDEEKEQPNKDITEEEWNAYRYFHLFSAMGFVLDESDELKGELEFPMYQTLQATLNYCKSR